MILDLPDTKIAVDKKGHWTIFELIAFGLSIVVIVVRDTVSYYEPYDTYLLRGHLAFAVSYLVAFYWIDKPRMRSERTAIVTFVYGIAFAALTLASFVFLSHYVRFSDEVTIVCLGVMMFAFLLDLLWSSKARPMVVNNRILVRFGVFALLIAFMYIVPEHQRVEMTFRKYPWFLDYYGAHYKENRFGTIYWSFVQKHGEPKRME
ncbi:MAG: hypothetical protein WDO15_06000 [Bacteroidota bacterium]